MIGDRELVERDRLLSAKLINSASDGLILKGVLFDKGNFLEML